MCAECEWKSCGDDIDDMISSGKCDLALETLEGIMEWVRINKHITEKQMIAINNIEEKMQE